MRGQGTLYRLKQAGLVLLFLLVFLCILLLVAPKAHAHNSLVLKGEVQTLLDAHYPKEYTVGEELIITSPLSVSCSMYNISLKDSYLKSYALVVRMQTIYGAYPGVFLWAVGENTKFVGFIGLEEALGSGTVLKVSRAIIDYWQIKVSSIAACAIRAQAQRLEAIREQAILEELRREAGVE